MRYVFSSLFLIAFSVQLLGFPTNLPQIPIFLLGYFRPLLSLFHMPLLLLRPNKNKSKQYNKVNFPSLPILQHIPQIMIPFIHILDSMQRKPR